jgi:PAS domain S-box-containing protein
MNPERLSRADLVRRVRELEAASAPAPAVSQLREQELQVQREEILAQNEQLRQMQHDLELSRDRYAELYDFAPVGYAALDQHGFVREINLTGTTLLGVDRKHVVGFPLWRYVHGDDRGRLHEHLHQASQSARDHVSEVRLIAKGGREFPAQLTTHRIHGVKDQARAVFRMAITDLTELRRTEHERQLALLREQAARTAGETKDRLIAVVSHELRTPLAAMMLWAKILQIKLHDQPEHAKALDVLVRSAEAQRQLIDDLLDISRISSGKLRLNLKIVTLTPLIEAAVESVLPMARAKGVLIALDLEEEVGALRADPDRLQQVFWNLLTNAVKFTPAGGQIRVSGRRVGRDADVRVVDSGRGIEPTFLRHMFEPFQQGDDTVTTRAQGGLGLGLAISKQLVEHHGGSIHVMSDGPGKGATFVVRLPLPDLLREAPASGVKDGATQERRAPGLGGLKVLLVEDEPATRSALVALVSEDGANVVAVDSAQAAVEAFQRVRPDLIIGDIGMAGQDGYEMMRRLRALEHSSNAAPVPALALTAFVTAADSRQALLAGFDGHLGKPVEPANLLTTLRRLAQRGGVADSGPAGPDPGGSAHPAEGGSAGQPDAGSSPPGAT